MENLKINTPICEEGNFDLVINVNYLQIVNLSL